MTDRFVLKNIYKSSGVYYFNDDFRYILEEVIKELYYSHKNLTLKLNLKHIDRAIFKYKQAKEQRQIWNSKKYFKACILSAIKEAALDEFEDL